MKPVIIKRIEVSTNGTISFFSGCFHDLKQVVFYEKDLINSQFFSKLKQNQISQSSFYTSYKSKYNS
jgi:DNA-binding GntR family transcriptional regulator